LGAIRSDRLGRIWILTYNELPLVFDSLGRFLANVGSRGRGPGELLGAVEIADVPGDSVLIVDPSNSRATLFDARLKAGRTIVLPHPTFSSFVVIQWPDTVITTGEIPTASASGWPLHIVSFAGSAARVTHSFGPESGEALPYRFGRLRQHLAKSVNGRFWSIDETRYRLTHRAASGEPLRQFIRQPTWFAGPVEYGIGTPTIPPPPATSGVIEAQDTLWTVLRLPADTWRSGWPNAAQREYAAREIAYERMFTSAIEVLDLGRGRVVARLFSKQWIVAILPGPRVAAYAVDDEGEPVITVSVLQLRPR
jgi:hypothetical protein